jgi:hypothetical protein
VRAQCREPSSPGVRRNRVGVARISIRKPQPTDSPRPAVTFKTEARWHDICHSFIRDLAGYVSKETRKTRPRRGVFTPRLRSQLYSIARGETSLNQASYVCALAPVGASRLQDTEPAHVVRKIIQSVVGECDVLVHNFLHCPDSLIELAKVIVAAIDSVL